MSSNHCIIYEQDELLKFTDEIIDNRTLLILPFIAPPYSTLQATSEVNKFELCGPLLMLIIEFARLHKTYIKLKGMIPGLMQMIMTIAEESVDIIIAPVVSAQVIKYIEGLANFGVTLKNTDCIGYFEADVIAARKYQGIVPMFSFMFCFPKEVWILILVSLIILSMVSSFGQKLKISSLRMLYHNLFNFSIALVKQPLESLILNSISHRIVILWLISAFTLSTQFTAYLMDFMIKAVPMVRIDTMEELAQHKDMRILVRYDDSFVVSTEMGDTPLKRTLKPMLKPYEVFQEIFDDTAQGLRNGSLANVNKRDMLIFNLIMLTEYEKRQENEPRLIDLLHISEKTDFYEPYFMLYNEGGPQWMTQNINTIIQSTMENGMSLQWLTNVYNSNRKRIGNFGRKSKEQAHKFSELSISNIFDLFYLLGFGQSISFILFMIELVFKPRVKLPDKLNVPRRSHVISMNNPRFSVTSSGYFPLFAPDDSQLISRYSWDSNIYPRASFEIYLDHL